MGAIIARWYDRAVSTIEDWKLPWEGGCRCGQTRFRVTAPPLLAAACHCTGCQRMTASAFSLSLAVPSEGFAITSGSPVIGGLHGAPQHFMCAHCLSWMFTRPDGMPELVNLRATMLDDHAWFAPFAEFWTSEQLPWATTSAPHSFPTMGTAEDFPELLAGYQQHGARPR